MDTFVVRVWPGQAFGVRGLVEHVRSGDESVFHDHDQLLAFIRAHAAGPAEPPQQPDGPQRAAGHVTRT